MTEDTMSFHAFLPHGSAGAVVAALGSAGAVGRVKATSCSRRQFVGDVMTECTVS